MSRCDAIVSECEGFFKEEVELHEIVAEDIGIGRSSIPVFPIDIVDDAFLILFTVVEGIEGKIEKCSYFLRFFEVRKCRAASGILFIEIVDHESTGNIISLFLQEVRRYR